MIALFLVVIGIFVMASKEVDWHYCLPVVIVIAIIGVVSVILSKKR